MEDGTRSAPATGFQKFLLDPKSSVKTYLSEIQEKDKHNWQHNGQNAGSPNQPQQANWQQQQQQQQQQYGQQGYQSHNSFPERPATAAANHQYQASQQFGAPPLPNTPSFPLNSPPVSNAGFAPPPHAPTPVHPDHQLSQQFTQHPQQIPAPQHDQGFGAPPSAFYPPEPNHPQHAAQASMSSVTVTSTSTETNSASRSGLAPPGHEHNNTVVTAPKQYHRMTVEFETLKAVYFAAKIQPTHGDLTPIASKLKTLAHEIWNHRYTRSSEFDFPAAAHEQIITTWKAQFDLWTDILDDLHDPVYVKTVTETDEKNEYHKLAGLSISKSSTTTSSVKKTIKPKAVAPAAETEEPVAAPKKKVVKKTVSAEGDTEKKTTVVKKKVVKKVAAAE